MFPKFSCHPIHKRRINGGSVNALLPARDDLLRLARVGNAFAAFFSSPFVGLEQSELLEKTQLAHVNEEMIRGYQRC
jgi:hypothetical protein